MSSVSEKKYEIIINSILNEVIKKQAASSSSYDVSFENNIILELCRCPSIKPFDISRNLEKIGISKDTDEIIRILRAERFFLGNPVTRKAFFERINELAKDISDIMHDCENKENIKKLEEINIKDYIIEKSRNQYIHKIIVIAIFNAVPELRDSESFKILLDSFGKTYCIHLIGHIFKKIRTVSMKSLSANQQKLSEHDQLQDLIEENERTNQLLAELHDEFSERLEAAKMQELTEFFSMLNSEKYSYIIDELFLLRKGFNTLRKNNYEIPPEIGGIGVAMNNFMQFIKDAGISPMVKPETIKEVTMESIDDYYYEGTPFTDNKQKKKVLVVSPGWVWNEKDIIISRPKVREIE